VGVGGEGRAVSFQSKYLLTLEDATKERTNFIEISNKLYGLIEIFTSAIGDIVHQARRSC
jgi:hypothetical protein